MKRNEFKFQFGAQALREAAEKKKMHHAGRLGHYENEFAAADKEMTETARVEEVPITGGTQRVLRYDQGLEQKVNKLRMKRDFHEKAYEGYARWVRALTVTDGYTSFSLDIDDVEYFGL